jgi:hypothetical protein
MKRHPGIRTRAVLTVTSAATLAVGLGLGTATGTAQASGDAAASTLASTAFTDTGNGSSVGVVQLDDLMSPLDFSDAMQVRTVTATMGPARRAALSACTGEQRMAQLLPGSATVLRGYYRGRAHGARVEADEVAGDHAGLAAYRKVVRELRGCQSEPAMHWHYGKLHRDDIGAGRAIWMVTVDGDGHRDGGVVAAWSHRHLAVAEVSGGSTADLEMVATDVSLRLR